MARRAGSTSRSLIRSREPSRVCVVWCCIRARIWRAKPRSDKLRLPPPTTLFDRGERRMSSRILDNLRNKVLLFDGAMGTQIQARDLQPDDFGGKRWEGCNDYLSLTRPDVIEAIHNA